MTNELKTVEDSSNLPVIDEWILEDDSSFNGKEDELDIKANQSVISHLLKQIVLGVDYTKVNLPAFVLESRSMLEMYADYFSCTDLLLQIPDLKTSHERMIQVYIKCFCLIFNT